MTPVALFLLTIAGIFLIGAAGEIVFRKTQIPDVLWLIIVGLVLGPMTGLITRPELAVIAPYFAALTLVIVLFEGGSRLKLTELSRAAPRSGLLAILTFVVSVAALAPCSMGARAVGWLPEEWSWEHGILLGTILGGSSSIVVMPSMARAQVEAKVANLVNLESAFTDAFCVVGASAMIDILAHKTGSTSSPGIALARSLGIGLAAGSISGAVWLVLLRVLRGSEHAYPVTLAFLLALYVATEHLGGSAALAILAFAVIVGNAQLIGKRLGSTTDLDLGKDVRGVHSQIAFIIKSFFFTFIGAMLGPPWSLLAFGALLGGVLFVARVPGVRIATLASGLGPSSRRLVALAMPRGMAAGVLATLPAAAGIRGTEQLATIVFAAVLSTILIFAVGFPLVRRAMQGEARGDGETVRGSQPRDSAPTSRATGQDS